MMDFEYWFDGVLGDCELICSERAIWRVWVERDKTITSIYDYDELYEQLFGDLDLDFLIDEFASKIGDVKTVDALRNFAEALRTLDSQVESQAKLKSPKIYWLPLSGLSSGELHLRFLNCHTLKIFEIRETSLKFWSVSDRPNPELLVLENSHRRNTRLTLLALPN